MMIQKFFITFAFSEERSTECNTQQSPSGCCVDATRREATKRVYRASIYNNNIIIIDI